MNSRSLLAEIAGVAVSAGGQSILSGIDLDIHGGEIVSLIGPNGAGKTTLVRVVLGLIAPAHGRVWRKAGLRIGYVPQRLVIDPVLPLRVDRFLALSGNGSRRAQEQALDEVGAGHVIDRPVQSVSGGEFQRLLLARALLRDPELLVLDEPVQGVDVTGQAEIYELIARIRDLRRCGVLLVSHDLHLVMAATDRVICINHHLCCEGLPEAVSRHPEYVALFGPQVAARIAPYTHHHDHVHGAGGEVLPIGAAPAHHHAHTHGHDHVHGHEHGHDHVHGHGAPQGHPGGDRHRHG